MENEREFIISLDIGTSNIKAGLISFDGKLYKVCKERTPLLSKLGRAEVKPQLLFKKILKLIKVLGKDKMHKIRAITFSTFFSSVIFLDKRGNELTNIITWLDERGVEGLKLAEKRLDYQKIYKHTGCPPLYIYPLAKIMWIKSHAPHILEKTRYVLDPKSYILFKLLSQPYSDLSTASTTQFLNIHTLQWDENVLNMIEVDKSFLPHLLEGDTILDDISPEIRRELSLPEDVVIVPSVYDGAAFVLGLGGLSEGIGFSHLGTSAMFRVIVKRPILNVEHMEIQTHYLWRNMWIPGAGINNAGMVFDWLSKNILRKSITKVINSISSEEISEDTPVAIPLLTPERMPSLSKLSGILIYGLKPSDTDSTLVLSLLLGILFLFRKIKQMIEDQNIRLHEVRIGGGGAASDVIVQLLADTLQLPVLRSRETIEAGLIGNTILVLRAFGHSVPKDLHHESEIFEPDRLRSIALNKLYTKFLKLLNEYVILGDKLQDE